MKKIFMATAVAATALLSACNQKASKSSMKSDADTVSYALGMVNSIPATELKNGLSQMGSDSAYTDDFVRGVEDGIKAAADKKQLAYYVGVQQGMMIYQRDVKGIEGIMFANDSTQHLNAELIIAGYLDALNAKGQLKGANDAPISQQELQMMIQRIIMAADSKNKEAKYAEYKKENEAYMANIAKQEGVKPLANGVYYKEITAGKGDTVAVGKQIEIEYEGRLINDTVFDSSKQRNETAKFPVGVGAVVPGFDEALKHITIGSEWEVYIPAEQGYGAQDMGNIKPFSTIIFKIKAISEVKEDK